MNCKAFERWLDDGVSAAYAVEARRHAAGCARCAAALAAAEAIEVGLARASFAAPVGLTDRVMARVAAIEARRTVAPPAHEAGDAFPWWVRAAGDPAVAVAMVLSAVLFWQWGAIARLGVSAANALGRVSAGATMPGLAWVPSGLAMQIALALILVPASLWLGRAAFRASEHWMERAAGLRA